MLTKTGETQISITDPDSRLMAKLNLHKMAYNVQTAVDGKNKMVVDFDVINTPDRGNMHHLAKRCKEVLETDTLTSLGRVPTIRTCRFASLIFRRFCTDFFVVCLKAHEKKYVQKMRNNQPQRCVFVSGNTP